LHIEVGCAFLDLEPLLGNQSEHSRRLLEIALDDTQRNRLLAILCRTLDMVRIGESPLFLSQNPAQITHGLISLHVMNNSVRMHTMYDR
ncbi:hypothetical protein PENTCL1PPCAC_511, partial [Pristionchus entomophagus]